MWGAVGVDVRCALTYHCTAVGQGDAASGTSSVWEAPYSCLKAPCVEVDNTGLLPSHIGSIAHLPIA